MKWTKEDIRTLTMYWEEGCSGSKIAERLGRSRSAILGKINRLGIQRKIKKSSFKQDILKPLKFDGKGYVTISKDKLPVKRRDKALANVAFVGKKLADLEHDQCRWPVGSGKDMIFCAAKRAKGSPYCAEHEAVSKVPYNKKKVTDFRNFKGSPKF